MKNICLFFVLNFYILSFTCSTTENQFKIMVMCSIVFILLKNHDINFFLLKRGSAKMHKYIIVIYYFHWVICLDIIIKAGHLSLLIETKWMFMNIKICTEKFQVSYDFRYQFILAILSNFGNSKQFGLFRSIIYVLSLSLSLEINL